MGHKAIRIIDVQEVFEPVGAHQRLNLTALPAQTLTPPTADVSKVRVMVEGTECRYTLDGTDPDTGTQFGFSLSVASVIVLPVSAATVLKFIDGGGSILQYQWGK
jgi:hypothetical protein